MLATPDITPYTSTLTSMFPATWTRVNVVQNLFHTALHSKKARGGAFNHQWCEFFKHMDDPTFIPPAGEGWKYYNPANPRGSIESFLGKLREVTTQKKLEAWQNTAKQSGVRDPDIRGLEWPHSF